jgi:hypothetical protein
VLYRVSHCLTGTWLGKVSRSKYGTSTSKKLVARRQDQTFADWFAELRELAGERWPDVADQAPTVYAVWGGGATPAQALYMVGLILPPKTAAA